WDRTNYFQNVPVSALDKVLWLESDRMGHLLGAIDQAKLDEQRGVVQNEKRQRENQPYGKAADIQYKSIYPPNHPYSWTTIGSMEDLNAASLEDVKNWFKTYYGAANTVLVIAGDVESDEVIKKVEHYFGEIPSGPPLTRHDSWPAKLTGKHKEVSWDRVPQTMILKSWNIPEKNNKTTTLLSMAGSILSSGKNSRLYKRLVYETQMATSAQAYTSAGEIAGTFEMMAMVKPGISEEAVSEILDEELKRFIAEGPTSAELEKVKIQTLSSFVRGMENVGGFGGKSDLLASNYTYTGDPVFYNKTLEWIKDATAKEIRAAMRSWLTDGEYHLEIRPYPDTRATDVAPDRKTGPETTTPPVPDFDTFERTRLDNGLNILFARRSTVPVIQMQLSVNAGYAADQFSRAGVASLAMNMLDEGTHKRNALEISEDLIVAGASISSGSNLDTSFVSLNTLKTTLDDALKLFAEVILEPAFPEKEFTRLKSNQITRIRNEQSNPSSMAIRVLPGLIYGNGHAYSNPLTGSGTVASVGDITLSDLKNFHQTWFKPNNATLIIVGDTRLADILPAIRKHFGGWKAKEVPEKNISPVEKPAGSQLYLVDKPGAPQSLIIAGTIATPKANPDEAATIVMNNIIGGNFSSRINMNLREDKHWSYGSFSGLINARGQRIFYAYAPVETDKTSESISELIKEFQLYTGSRPATSKEISVITQSEVLSLAGRWESAGAVLGSLSQIVQYRLPDDYFNTYAHAITSVTPADVKRIARQIIEPDRFIWVVVGDQEKIAGKLERLGLGPVTAVDSDGIILDPDARR
ncbi:MAG: insulinase family protein, partial [Gammaproteobacteria bacterium]|nr:insulinase family protein [Gammaproteobacteria bacterium]